MRKFAVNRIRTALKTGTVALCLLSAGGLKADVTYDATLASPDTNAANNTDNLSWYNGSGNQGVQGDWTVDSDNGIEIGLRAKLRNAPSLIAAPTGDYVVPPGDQNAGHALWNYEFSIDLEPNGVGTLNLSDVTATLMVTDLNNPSDTNTVDLYTLAFDNSGFGTTNGTTGADRIDESIPTLAAFEAGWGLQNSENPEFSNWPLGTFNSSLATTYQFVLTVNEGDTILAQDTMDVTVTPEPSSLIPVGILAVSLVLWRRRRKTA